jgi:hypothetical protein
MKIHGGVRLCVAVIDGARCHLPDLKIFKKQLALISTYVTLLCGLLGRMTLCEDRYTEAMYVV